MTLETDLGNRLKRRRDDLGISLRELARRTELTASFLSQVERGKTSVSLDSLRRIAETLEVPLFYFLSDMTALQPEKPKEQPVSNHNRELSPYSPVVRREYRPKLFLPLSGIFYEKLIPDMGRKMEALYGRLAPGTGNVARRLREQTEEFIFLVAGSLKIGLTSGDYILNPGDTIYFEGKDLQKIECVSQEEAVWISVITPAVF